MKKISFSDKIFATVNVCGRTIFNAAIDGMSSIEDVMRYVGQSVRGLAQGMVTVVLRNGSQGWIERRMMRVASVRAKEGVQLSLF